MINKTALFLPLVLFVTHLTYSIRMTGDTKLLRRAIEIALEGIRNGYGPFGAVVSKNGKIVAGSENQVVLLKDPTAHAEILAIRKAAGILKTHDLSGCILYTSCEPCPMCLGAIYWSGIKTVVYASDRDDAAEAGFNDSLFHKEISLDSSERQITFIQIKDPSAVEVFTRWKKFENKIQY